MNVRTTVAALAIMGPLCAGCASQMQRPVNAESSPYPVGVVDGGSSSTAVDTAPLSSPYAASSSVSPYYDSPAGGTFVGARVSQLRADLDALDRALAADRGQLQQIKQSINSNGQAYHGVLAGVQGRLQAGSTPGNPQLVNDWNRAQAQLGMIDSDIARLNQLSTKVGNDGSMSGYLLDAVRAAYGLSGAVEEDHRQLRILEERAGRTGLGASRLQVDVGNEISRQIGLVNAERNNLQNLTEQIRQGDIYNPQMRERLYTAPTLQERPRSGAVNPYVGASVSSDPLPAPALGGSRPLVIIKFDAPNVNYEQPLYQAINRAIQARPSTNFDVVAVSASGGSGRGEAERVYRSMVAMGVPAERLRLSASSSEQARSNEVHIFAR
jgi:hypothetical protein